MPLYNSSMKIDERYDLDLNGPGNYRVRNGHVYTRAVEINAVKHCNLSCRGCSHSSPISEVFEYDPSVLFSDLSSLAMFLNCESIRIVGGEPLLHSSFIDVLKQIKDSHISEKICLVTNGLLLNKLDDTSIAYIDEIQISEYPLSDSLREKIEISANLLHTKGIKVRILDYSFFRESISKNETSNSILVKRIYSTCQIGHFLRCITVDQGYLYRCPQSMVYAKKTQQFNDSISIASIHSVEDILRFLENDVPLKACSSCLGSVGRKIPHEQVTRNQWETTIPRFPEDAIDEALIRDLELNMRLPSGCAERIRF